MPQFHFTPRRLVISGVAVTGCAALLAAAPVVWATTDAEPAAQDCQANALPGAEDLRRGLPADVDSTGRYLVADVVAAEGDDSRIQLWDNEELTDPEIDLEGQSAAGVNADGVIVGSYEAEETSNELPLRFDGETTELPLPDDAQGAKPTAINDSGDISGFAELAEDASYDERTPVKWSADGELVELELPADATAGTVEDIADDGTAVGHYMDAESEVPRAVLWDAEGNTEEIPAHFAGKATAIGGDFIVGHNEDDDKPVIWQRGEDDFQELPEGTLTDVTPDGDALGYNESGHFVHNDDGETPLLDEDGEATTSEDLTTAISDAGDLVAGGLADREALPQATTWTCG